MKVGSENLDGLDKVASWFLLLRPTQLLSFEFDHGALRDTGLLLYMLGWGGQ